MKKFLDGIITADINPIVLSFLFSTLPDAKSKTRTKSISVLHRTPSFYPSIKEEEEDVNALLWASLFSTRYVIDTYVMYDVCQCPSSGFSLFYSANGNEAVSPIDVSMPFFGLLSFLQCKRKRGSKSY